MKIGILTSGILPVPAVQGGAVENFLDFFLEYNDQHKLHDITVYSVWHPNVDKHPALKSKVNHYYYINVSGFIAKIKKRLFGYFHKDTHYHYSIEYYLHKSLNHLLQCNYDMIIMNNRPGYTEELTGKTNAKLVYNLYNDKLNAKTRASKEIYNAATLIISTSNYITNRVKTIKGYESATADREYDSDKCLTIYSGIELQRFKTDFVSKIHRNDLHLNQHDFIMLFSGRVTQEKGIMELIEAMNQLKDYQSIKLLVIGSSFYGNADNENDFAKSLKEKAEPLKDNIIFTGFIPYSEMPNYLSIADVAVVPSIWDDPFPTTVLEAQAMGLPVIATRRGGIPEEVTPETAILLETDEHFVQRLAETILELYQHPEKRQTMSLAAIEHSKYFDKERYARDFFKALETI